MQALEEENRKLIDKLNIQSSETESDLAAAEAAKEDYVSQLDQLIADRNAQAEKEEEARRQAEANQKCREQQLRQRQHVLPARVIQAMF